MLVVVLVSAGLSVCKSLQFDINMDYPQYAFPLPVIQNPKRLGWQQSPGHVCVFVINILYNILNYFIFVLVHLGVDFFLIKNFWQAIREKEEKMAKMKRSAHEMENSSRENEESKRRALWMVILNSSVNFCTKLPLMITSLGDLLLIIKQPYAALENDITISFRVMDQLDRFESKISFSFFCSSIKGCLVFQNFGNCLYLFSLAIIFFFLKRFDKNFKVALQNAFNRNLNVNKVR